MLFVLKKPLVAQFWMLDCGIDMDIVFLDSLGVVTAAYRMNANPQRLGETRASYEGRLKLYSSMTPMQFALELKAGTIHRLGVKTGEKVTLDVRRLKSLAR